MSFASEVKKEILNIEDMSKCCEKALIFGMLQGTTEISIALGGVKQGERMHEDVVVERYAINVSESVEKYKDVYGVKNNNQK